MNEYQIILDSDKNRILFPLQIPVIPDKMTATTENSVKDSDETEKTPDEKKLDELKKRKTELTEQLEEIRCKIAQRKDYCKQNNIVSETDTELQGLITVKDALQKQSHSVQVQIVKLEKKISSGDSLKAGKRANDKFSNIMQEATAFWFKFYAEQCNHWHATDSKGNPVDIANPVDLFDEQCEQLNKVFCSIVLDPDCPFDVHGIKHTKDESETAPKGVDPKDYFWQPSIEKPHGHLLLIVRKKNGKRRPVTLQTVLNYLEKHGLSYRHTVDDDPKKAKTHLDTALLMENGVLRINTKEKRHIRCIVYHTHESDDAIDNKGKHTYERMECYTNIDPITLNEYYDYYFSSLSKHALQTNSAYVTKARELGQTADRENAISFDDWWYNLPYKVQKLVGLKRDCKDAFNYGLSELFRKSTMKTRCAIYIKGNPDIGKTTNARLALEEIFSAGCVHRIEQGMGTGKTDKIQPYHKAILVSDCTLPGIMGIADSQFTDVWKRGSDNAVFFGSYVIITGNIPFEQYIEDNYSNANWYKGQSTVDALFDRFFEIEVDDSGDWTLSRFCARGSNEQQAERFALFTDFVTRFENHVKTYLASKQNASQAPQNAVNDFLKLMGAKYQPKTAQPFTPSYVPGKYPCQNCCHYRNQPPIACQQINCTFRKQVIQSTPSIKNT